MRRAVLSERGFALVWLAVVMGLISLLLVVAVDATRVWALWGRLQAIVDAAALAGAGSARVREEVDAFGNVYSRQLALDPVEAVREASRCLDENLRWLGVPREDLLEESRTVDVSDNTIRVRVVLVARRFLPPPWNTLRIVREATAEALAEGP
jgi:Flp pilus assembly protein TadG